MSAPPKLAIVGTDLSRLLQFVRPLQSLFAVSVVETPRPLQASDMTPLHRSQVAIVEITHRDSAQDIHVLLDRMTNTRFLFLAETLPLRPAVARTIREAGHAVVSQDEQPVVVVSTVLALLAQTHAA
jgi:hypothetical protein